MNSYLADIALRPAVLRRKPISMELDSIDISVNFGGKLLQGDPLKLDTPFLWGGENAPLIVKRVTSGGWLDPALFGTCKGAELDLTPRGPAVRSLAMEGPKDLRNNLNLLREATRHKVPVWVRMACGDVYDDMKIALKAGADGVLLDSRIGRGLPLSAAIPPALRALDELGGDRAEQPKLMVAAGPPLTRETADHVKLLAMGVDIIYLTGEYEANEIRVLADEVARLVGLCGHSSLEGLSTEDLYALTYDIAALTGLRLAGYDSRIPLWSH